MNITRRVIANLNPLPIMQLIILHFFSSLIDGGDNNIYSTRNATGYIYPVTCERHFENKIKAAPSVFSFAKVPQGVPVHPWPKNPDWMHSGRLIGVNDNVANWKSQLFDRNVRQRWMRQYQQMMGQLGSGNQNLTGGIDKLAASGIGYLSGRLKKKMKDAEN